MADEQAEKKPFDVKGAIEKSASKTTIQELAKKGIHRVKVLDESAIQRLIEEAVKRTLATKTDALSEEERDVVFKQSRKELDRLMKEHKELKGRAELVEQDKNTLVREVENLQEQLKVTRKVSEESGRQRYDEGRADMKERMEGQIELLKERMANMESEIRGRVEGEYRAKLDDALQRERDAQERLAKALENARAQDAELFAKMEQLFTKSLEGLNKKLQDLKLRAVAGGPLVGAGAAAGGDDFKLSQATIENLFKQELDSNLKGLEVEEQTTKSKIGGALDRLKKLREGGGGEKKK